MSANPVLITAFGPFPGVEKNPMEEVLGLVREHWSGPRPLIAEVLEVAFDTVPTKLRRLIEEHRPAAVVSMGVNRHGTRLELEARAFNEIGADTPDARGDIAAGPIVAEGPDSWHSPFRVDEAVRVLGVAGLPIVRSDDAGRYLCNAALAVACDALRDQPEAGAVFLHIPPADVLTPDVAARAALALACGESWWGVA